MHTTAFKKTDKSAHLRGLIVILLLLGLWNPTRSQTRNDDGWNSSRLVLATVNAEVLLHPSTAESGPFQNMAYGFKIGKNTLRKCGWYVGAMSNFKLFGAFKTANEQDIYPYVNSISFLEADFGLTFHVYKPLSYHIGTGYFYRTTNYLDHDFHIVHLKGSAINGLALTTGFTWHLELTDKYIRDKSPEKVSLSAEFVSLFAFNGKTAADKFSYGLKLGVGICSAKDVIRYQPILPEDIPQQEAPPVIAENKATEKNKDKAEKAEPKREEKIEEPKQEEQQPTTAEPKKEPKARKVAPSVEIGVASEVSEYSVYITGLVRDEGSSEVTQKGFCYSRYGTPDLGKESHSQVIDSRSISFGGRINHLQPGTTYAIRAYAINDVDTSYSSVISVKTKDILSINSIYDLKPTSVTIVYANTSEIANPDEVVRRGICYADSSNSRTPTVFDNVILRESNAIFQIIDSLESGKHYYVRAFTEKANGTVDYSESVSFTTPTYLITQPVTNIGSNSAMCGGSIQHTFPETIMLAGTCWSLKNPNPTTANTRTGDVVTNGSWTSAIENLKPNTQYWIRSYVMTSSGKVYYGNVITFTTLP